MQQQKQQLGALWPRCHSDWEQVTRLLDAALNFDEAMKKCLINIVPSERNN